MIELFVSKWMRIGAFCGDKVFALAWEKISKKSCVMICFILLTGLLIQ